MLKREPKKAAAASLSLELIHLSPRAGRGATSKRLHFGFDDVAPHGLDCLLALGRKIRPGLRLVEGNRVVQAVPFGDRHILRRRRAIDLNDASGGGAEGPAMGRL